jgi:hypothetical protein
MEIQVTFILLFLKGKWGHKTLQGLHYQEKPVETGGNGSLELVRIFSSQSSKRER